MTNQNNSNNNKRRIENSYRNNIAQDTKINSINSGNTLELNMLNTKSNDSRIKIANSMPQQRQEHKQ